MFKQFLFSPAHIYLLFLQDQNGSLHQSSCFTEDIVALQSLKCWESAF